MADKRRMSLVSRAVAVYINDFHCIRIFCFCQFAFLDRNILPHYTFFIYGDN